MADTQDGFGGDAFDSAIYEYTPADVNFEEIIELDNPL